MTTYSLTARCCCREFTPNGERCDAPLDTSFDHKCSGRWHWCPACAQRACDRRDGIIRDSAGLPRPKRA